MSRAVLRLEEGGRIHHLPGCWARALLPDGAAPSRTCPPVAVVMVVRSSHHEQSINRRRRMSQSRRRRHEPSMSRWMIDRPSLSIVESWAWSINPVNRWLSLMHTQCHPVAHLSYHHLRRKVLQ